MSHETKSLFIEKRNDWGHQLENSLELMESGNKRITIQFKERINYPMIFSSTVQTVSICNYAENI